MTIKTQLHRDWESHCLGPRWLVEERDACGVGFIADQYGRASRSLVQKSLGALTCMEHRGGCSADQDSGDGAGVMTAIPWKIIQAWIDALDLAPSGTLAVGMVFLPQGSATEIAKTLIEREISESVFDCLGWREVPVDPSVLGPQARENQPQIEQVVLQSDLEGDALERELYLLRCRVGNQVVEAIASGDLSDEAKASLEDLYICSLSGRTIVYKGMVRSAVLGEFYLDFKDENYESPFAFYHRRFSTNTLPRWPLAQPMRILGHNGEINTLLGNVNWMLAR